MSTKSKTKPAEAGQPVEARRPRIILPVGRGTRGKSFLSEFLISTALTVGRAPIVGDGDRQNQALSARFAGVLMPPSADEADMRAWVASFFETVIANRNDAFLDLGAGDLTLRRSAKELELLPWLDSLGIDLVILHLLGPNADDMAHLASVEEAGLAAPMTVLVLNEGAVPPNRDPAAAFGSTIGAHPVLAATVGRGARIVRLPRLDCAPEMQERGIGLAEALEGRVPEGVQPLGPWANQQLALWRRRTTVALAPVADRLL